MYHIKITKVETGETKVDEDVIFCAGTIGSIEKGNTRYTLSERIEKPKIMDIIKGLQDEARFLQETYLK